MQRIFDVENEKDMQDLWNILSEEVIKVKKQNYGPSLKYYGNNNNVISITDVININWHDKTEITRPIPEVTEKDVGKLCVFWDNDSNLIHYGILQSIATEAYRLQNNYPYSECYHHCRRLTKQEIEELC